MQGGVRPRLRFHHRHDSDDCHQRGGDQADTTRPFRLRCGRDIRADFAARIVSYLYVDGLVDETPTPDQQAIIDAAAPLVQERVQLLGEVPGLLGFLFRDVAYHDDALAGLPANTGEVLVASVAALELIPETEFTTAAVQEALASALIEGLGLKPRVAYGPLRVALSGRRVSPPLFESMELLGKAESIRRLGALVEHQG